MHNIWIFGILWDWHLDRIAFVVAQTIWLQYHLQHWKHAKRILSEKHNKNDYILVKLYYVISLLNSLEKVLKKFVAKQLLEFCEINEKLLKR